MHVLWLLQGLAMLNGQDQTDVLWAGDMNWNAEDGDPPLPAGWYALLSIMLHIIAKYRPEGTVFHL